MLRVSIIIIGDEILSAKFPDENTGFLINRCSELGVEVHTVRIIRDNLETIATTVLEESNHSDYVFTTGGVGPTHDDLTMQGIANAFDETLTRNPVLASLINEKMGPSVNKAALRMADVPESTKLWESAEGYFPQVVVRNVIIFPGVPQLLKRKFDAISHRFKQTGKITTKIFLTSRETEVADQLSSIQDKYPMVQIGSYPRFNELPVRLIFTLESYDQDKLNECAAELRTCFSHCLISEP